MKRLTVYKKERRLTLADEWGRELISCPVGLGFAPEGSKEQEGDGKTPEGLYFICLKRAAGKYGMALGISYPNEQDAQRAYANGNLPREVFEAICSATREGRRPPWGSRLGGEIYIHGGGAGDWTAGCIALNDEDMKNLFLLVEERDDIMIVP